MSVPLQLSGPFFVVTFKVAFPGLSVRRGPWAPGNLKDGLLISFIELHTAVLVVISGERVSQGVVILLKKKPGLSHEPSPGGLRLPRAIQTHGLPAAHGTQVA